MRRFTMVVAVLVTMGAMFYAGSANAGSPAKTGASVAFAKADIGTQQILSYGGKGVTAAWVSGGNSPYWIELTFIGKFYTYDEDLVIANTTCEGWDYGVANTTIYSVTPTMLVVAVDGWVSEDTMAIPGLGRGTDDGEMVFFSAFIGQ